MFKVMVHNLDKCDDSPSGISAVLAECDLSAIEASSDWVDAEKRSELETADRSLVTLVETYRKFAVLAKGSRWNAYLINKHRISDFIYSSRAAEVVINPDRDHPIEIELYRIPSATRLDPLSAKLVNVSKVGSIQIQPLGFWVLPEVGMGYDIVSSAESLGRWIILTGPALSSYFHVYSKSNLEYAYSAFADDRGASIYYICELLKSFAAEAAFANARSRATVLRTSEMILKMNEAPTIARWSIAQATSRIDRNMTLRALESLSNCEGPLGVRANELISRIERIC
jgi:hypothetical protein